MSTLLKFQLGLNVLQFEDAAAYPAKRSYELLQVTDRTSGGTLQVESLGILIKTRDLSFVDMSENDYLALVDWFINVVNGSEKSFTITDEYGSEGDVKITSQIIDFSETSYKRYSGSITVEYV